MGEINTCPVTSPGSILIGEYLIVSTCYVHFTLFQFIFQLDPCL